LLGAAAALPVLGRSGVGGGFFAGAGGGLRRGGPGPPVASLQRGRLVAAPLPAPPLLRPEPRLCLPRRVQQPSRPPPYRRVRRPLAETLLPCAALPHPRLVCAPHPRFACVPLLPRRVCVLLLPHPCTPLPHPP